MSRNLKNKILISFFLLLSLALTISFVGLKNISFNEVSWLLGAGDTSNSQNAWTFFKNDIWHFPFGKNPNYGMDISSSIIFTDSIPFLALLFKSLKIFIGSNFQYFSLWIFICFFLQLFISFALINNLTKNTHYAILSSFLLCISPIFLHRLGLHLALGGQWLILLAYYFNLCVEERKRKIYWICILIFSSYIHAYFTAMLFGMYSCFVVAKFIRKKNIKETIKDILFPAILLIIFMFLLGYFDNSIVNSIAIGFGIFNLDLIGIFDPGYIGSNLIWSYFIEDLKGTTIEGFNYFGIGNLILILAAILFFLKNSYKNKEYIKLFFARNISYIFLIIIFLGLSISTEITYKGEVILSLPLSKYLYGLFSIFGATARFFWPIYYLLIIFSLIYIFQNLKKNNYSIFFLYLILAVQIIDITPGIKYYFFDKKHINSDNEYRKEFKATIWKMIPNDYENLRTTYLFNNYGPLYSRLNYYIGTNKIKKTDIVLSAGFDRSKAALARYELLHNIHKKNNLPKNTAYIIDNLGHLRQMKQELKNSNVGFFNRDNFWLALPEKRNEMTNKDVQQLKDIKFKKLKINTKYEFNFKNRSEYLGFGWSHNFSSKGVWSEGEFAFILFNIDNVKEKNKKIYLKIKPYFNNNNNNFELIIYFNKNQKKIVKLSENKNFQVIDFEITKNELTDNNVIKFKFNNLISPYDILQSPDARKLGLLLESIIIK
jgi:hypothetical protein